MYEVVFTNVKTHMDLVSTISSDSLVQAIMTMLKSGLVLSELRETTTAND